MIRWRNTFFECQRVKIVFHCLKFTLHKGAQIVRKIIPNEWISLKKGDFPLLCSNAYTSNHSFTHTQAKNNILFESHPFGVNFWKTEILKGEFFTHLYCGTTTFKIKIRYFHVFIVIYQNDVHFFYSIFPATMTVCILCCNFLFKILVFFRHTVWVIGVIEKYNTITALNVLGIWC